MDLLPMLAAAAGNAGEEADEDFANTVLLLHGDGTNGAQNNTFLDSSTNNFTITRNGNTTQGTFSPFSKPDGRWGNYFPTVDASRLSSTVTAIGSGDFTIEFWLNAPTTPSDNVRVVRYGAFNTAGNFQILLLTSGVIRIDGNASTSLITGSVDLRFDGFHHVAITRSGSDLKLFVDGTQDGSTATFSANLTATALEIGGDSSLGALYDFDGWLSNVRTVTGTAVYTSGFTPSTSPLTAISGTSLLTCQSNRFVDNSSNAFAITAAGNVKVTPFSPFPLTTAYDSSVNGGAGYFDGSGDYLDPPSDAALGMGTGDFTIHFWVYLNSGVPFLIDFRPTSTQGLYPSIYCASSNGLRYYTNSADRITSTVPLIGRWTHIALIRSSGSTKLYANGSQVGSTYSDSNNYVAARPRIGANGFNGGDVVNGYLSSVAIVKGTAVWTTDFTPPTAPPTAIANTSLLCNFTNAGILDNTCFNALETVGNAQVDTSVVKYGTGSMKFDGTGDYLQLSDRTNFDFGTGDFTIEGWVYLAISPSSTYTIIDARSSDVLNEYFVGISATSKLDFIYSASRLTSATSVSATTWTHIAVTRESGTIRLFIGGVLDANTASYASGINTAASVVIGGGRSGGTSAISGYYFNGFIDDLRISRIARYTTTFTPPTKAFPDLGE